MIDWSNIKARILHWPTTLLGLLSGGVTAYCGAMQESPLMQTGAVVLAMWGIFMRGPEKTP